jgi:superfamily II DNA or RNA helicase
MTEKLFDYQVNHVENLVYSLTTYNRALDASDTGTGKTYTAISICKIFNWKPFIICPKSVISSWLKVLKYIECDFYGITNYESIQNCKYTDNKGKKVKAKFLVREQKPIEKRGINEYSDEESPIDKLNEEKDKKKFEYIYKWIKEELPQDILFIFDEAHRCKNIKTNNGRILANLSEISTAKILILSATMSDKPKYFMLVGYILKLYEQYSHGKYWIKKVGEGYDNLMQGVHKKIYPEYASRMKISNIKNIFKENSVKAECIEMDNAILIQKQYELIKQITEELKKKMTGSTALANLIYARQHIEILKIPSFIKLTKEHIEKGDSVVLFVNYTDTLMNLSEKLNTDCLIYGDQKIEERNNNIEAFNNDKKRICICNIKAGGCGISLHDTLGNHPRVAIISPTWSAQDLVQVLGRIYRAKTKSDSTQRIIFCKGTVEEGICANIKEKIENIAMLNDGDLKSYKIDGINNNENELDINETIKPKSVDFSGCLNSLNQYNQSNQSNHSNIGSNNIKLNPFEDMFKKLSELYELKKKISKEQELIDRQIKDYEEIIFSQLN